MSKGRGTYSLSDKPVGRTRMAERFAAVRLEALAQAEGWVRKTVPEVLFVCDANAGRSQMAAAFLTHLAGEKVEVRSAGSAPADAVNPAVVEAMAEEGIDVSGEIPKVPRRGRAWRRCVRSATRSANGSRA